MTITAPHFIFHEHSSPNLSPAQSKGFTLTPSHASDKVVCNKVAKGGTLRKPEAKLYLQTWVR